MAADQSVPFFTSAGGAVSFVLSILALAGVIYGWGWKARQQTETINGLGERVKTVEDAQKRSAERDTQWVLSLERVLEHNKQLVLAVGEAKGAAAACEEDMLEATQDIRNQINYLVRTINESDVKAEGRMASMETELRLLRQQRA